MMRGSGTRGAAGISPVRDNIVRPLLYCKKASIAELLDKFGIEYVIDSTNGQNDYKRNFVRHEVVSALEKIVASPQDMCTRSSRNLRGDDEFICSVADEFIKGHDRITNSDLLALHESVFARVISKISGVSLSHKNLREIRLLLSKNDFSYSMPEGKIFLCEGGACSVTDSSAERHIDYCLEINPGINVFNSFDSCVIVGGEDEQKSSLNVYKKSIQASLSSAIIKGDLYLRPRREGDSIYYGGVNRKLKKLFCDKKIPKSKRALVPILCDDKGPLYIPGLGVRDDGVNLSDSPRVIIGVGKGDLNSDVRFYFANEFVK